MPRSVLDASNPDVDYSHLAEVTFVVANRADAFGVQKKTGTLGIKASGLAFDAIVSANPLLGHGSVTPVPLTQASLRPTFSGFHSLQLPQPDGTTIADTTSTSVVTMTSPNDAVIAMNLGTNQSFAGAFFTTDLFNTATTETFNLDTAFPAGIVLGLSDQTPGAGRVKVGVTDINGRNDEVYLQTSSTTGYFQILTAQFDEVDRTQIKAMSVVVDQTTGPRTLNVDWGSFDFVPEISLSDSLAQITVVPPTSQNERPVLTGFASKTTPDATPDTSRVTVQPSSPQMAQLMFDTKFETSFGGAFLNYDYYLTSVHENIDLTSVFPAGITLGLSRSAEGPATVQFEVEDINGNKAKVTIKNIDLTEKRGTIPLSELSRNNPLVDLQHIQSMGISAKGPQSGILTVHWGDFSFARSLLPGDPSTPLTLLPNTSLGERPDLTPFKSEHTPEGANDASQVTLVQSSPENAAINYNLALESSYGGVFVDYNFYLTTAVENIDLSSLFPAGITLGLSRSADGPSQIKFEVTDVNGNKAYVSVENIGLTEGRWTALLSDFRENNPAVDLTHVKAIALVATGIQQGTLNIHWGSFKQANAISPDAAVQPVTFVPLAGVNRPVLTGFSSETDPSDGSVDTSTVTPEMLSRFDLTLGLNLVKSSSYGGVFFSYDNVDTAALETIDFSTVFPSGLTLRADNGGSGLSQMAFEITTVDASLPEGTRRDRVILSNIDATTHSWTIHTSDFHEGDTSKVVSIALVASGIHENQTVNVQWGDFAYTPVIVVSPSNVTLVLASNFTRKFANPLPASRPMTSASLTAISSDSGSLQVVSRAGVIHMAFQDGHYAAILAAKHFDLPVSAPAEPTLPPVPAGWTRAVSNSDFAYRTVRTVAASNSDFTSLEIVNLKTGQETKNFVSTPTANHFNDVDVAADGLSATFKIADADGKTISSMYYNFSENKVWTFAKSNSNFIFSGAGDENPNTRGLILRNLTTGDTQTLASYQVGIFGDNVFRVNDVSPTGDFVAFDNGRGASIQKINSPSQKLVVGLEYGLTSITWTTLSGHSAAVLNNRTTVDLQTLQIVVPLPAGAVLAASNSHYAFQKIGNKLYLIDAAHPDQKALVGSGRFLSYDVSSDGKVLVVIRSAGVTLSDMARVRFNQNPQTAISATLNFPGRFNSNFSEDNSRLIFVKQLGVRGIKPVIVNEDLVSSRVPLGRLETANPNVISGSALNPANLLAPVRVEISISRVSDGALIKQATTVANKLSPPSRIEAGFDPLGRGYGFTYNTRRFHLQPGEYRVTLRDAITRTLLSENALTLTIPARSELRLSDTERVLAGYDHTPRAVLGTAVGVAERTIAERHRQQPSAFAQLVREAAGDDPSIASAVDANRSLVHKLVRANPEYAALFGTHTGPYFNLRDVIKASDLENEDNLYALAIFLTMRGGHDNVRLYVEQDAKAKRAFDAESLRTQLRTILASIRSNPRLADAPHIDFVAKAGVASVSRDFLTNLAGLHNGLQKAALLSDRAEDLDAGYSSRWALFSSAHVSAGVRFFAVPLLLSAGDINQWAVNHLDAAVDRHGDSLAVALSAKLAGMIKSLRALSSAA